MFEQLATPGIRGLRPYQPGKPIDELERELGIANTRTRIETNYYLYE